MYYSIYTAINISPGPTPCISKHPLFYFLLFPATFLVVTTTHPPLSLVCQQLSHPLLCPPFTPHSSNYIIYTDISNLGRLRPGLWPYISSPPHGWPSNAGRAIYTECWGTIPQYTVLLFLGSMKQWHRNYHQQLHFPSFSYPSCHYASFLKHINLGTDGIFTFCSLHFWRGTHQVFRF